MSAMIDRMAERDQEPLPQDSQEGVADDEWVNRHSNYAFCNLILPHFNAMLLHRMTDVPKVELKQFFVQCIF